MKKDKRLEKTFEDYRGNVSASGTATSRAKAMMEQNERRVRRTPRKSVVFAICSVLICAVTVLGVGIYLSKQPSKNQNNAPYGDMTDNSQTAPSYYSVTSLDKSAANIYSESTSLPFLVSLEYASSSSVTELTRYDSNGSTVLWNAKVIEHHDVNTSEATIYVESGDKICEELKEFHNGASAFYNGINYLYFDDTLNGEPVKNILVIRGDVKYYISVMSSDSEAYKLYLKLLK